MTALQDQHCVVRIIIDIGVDPEYVRRSRKFDKRMCTAKTGREGRSLGHHWHTDEMAVAALTSNISGTVACQLCCRDLATSWSRARPERQKHGETGAGDRCIQTRPANGSVQDTEQHLHLTTSAASFAYFSSNSENCQSFRIAGHEGRTTQSHNKQEHPISKLVPTSAHLCPHPERKWP